MITRDNFPQDKKLIEFDVVDQEAFAGFAVPLGLVFEVSELPNTTVIGVELPCEYLDELIEWFNECGFTDVDNESIDEIAMVH